MAASTRMRTDGGLTGKVLCEQLDGFSALKASVHGFAVNLFPRFSIRGIDARRIAGKSDRPPASKSV